jgi:hypothetical protein
MWGGSAGALRFSSARQVSIALAVLTSIVCMYTLEASLDTWRAYVFDSSREIMGVVLDSRDKAKEAAVLTRDRGVSIPNTPFVTGPLALTSFLDSHPDYKNECAMVDELDLYAFDYEDVIAQTRNQTQRAVLKDYYQPGSPPAIHFWMHTWEAPEMNLVRAGIG